MMACTGDWEMAESVSTPASTGAQQLEAIPENTPNAKKPAYPPPCRFGAVMNDGIDHMRPDTDSTANTTISSDPSMKRTV